MSQPVLRVYHFTIEKDYAYIGLYGEYKIRHGFYFKPRIFRAGGATSEGLCTAS